MAQERTDSAGRSGDWGEVLLVANPISGMGRAARALPRVAAALRERGLAVEAMATGGPGDARQAASGFRPRRGLIIALGGDGTFNDVLNGADLERCTLAVLPAGAGNVLAKELGVSHNFRMAVGQLLRSTSRHFDVGVCNGRRFMCMFGAGVDAWIVKAICERRGGRLTQLGYLPHLIKYVVADPAWDITAVVDGEVRASGADQVSVANTHSYGGPIEVAPAADPCDGRLDVVSARLGGLTRKVEMALACFLRRLDAAPRAFYGRGRQVTVISSRSEVPWQVDGEFGGHLPAEISCQRLAARILVPAGFRRRMSRRGGDTDRGRVQGWNERKTRAVQTMES